LLLFALIAVSTALAVYRMRESLQQISKSDRLWNLIKGFYSCKRPETCRKWTFYLPLNQAWLTQRANHHRSASTPVASG
jgi:hypothetical protein